MSQPPKTDLARVLWETCPKCYGKLLADREGGLKCRLGHYRAANATSLPGRRIVADGGNRWSMSTNTLASADERACEGFGCSRTVGLQRLTNGDTTRILCRLHAKYAMRVSS
jgi:hypothetical protein